MVKITFEGINSTPEEMEQLRLYYSNKLGEDLSITIDSLEESFSLVSDDKLHLKPIYHDPDVKDALELCKIALESHCNTIHDEIVVGRVVKNE